MLLFLLCVCATVIAMEKLYSQWSRGPLFIYWATFFKRLRTAAIKNTLDVFHFDFCYILVTFFIEMVSLSEFSLENPLQKKVS